MKLELHVYLHDGDQDTHSLLTRLLAQGASMNAQIQAAIDDLKSKVQAETTVIASAKTLMDGLVAQIAALKDQLANGGDPATVVAGLTDLGTLVQANRDALAGAVQADSQQG